MRKCVIFDLDGTLTQSEEGITRSAAYALEKGINFDWNTASNAEKAELAMQMFMERTAQYAGNFDVDPFEGLEVLFNNTIPAFSAATTGVTYAIVGDLSALQFNYPEGDGIVLKYDDLSLAEDDLVKIVGRQYAAHGVTAPGRLVKVAKA